MIGGLTSGITILLLYVNKSITVRTKVLSLLSTMPVDEAEKNKTKTNFENIVKMYRMSY